MTGDAHSGSDRPTDVIAFDGRISPLDSDAGRLETAGAAIADRVVGHGVRSTGLPHGNAVTGCPVDQVGANLDPRRAVLYAN